MDFGFQFIHKFQSNFRQHFSSIILLAVMNERRILCYLVETNNINALLFQYNEWTEPTLFSSHDML